MERATFGAGCFWGVEADFRKLPGVISTQVGFTGGEVPEPTYKDVCRGDTGHAEVVEVAYDPEQVGYDQLLEVFWSSHDPTQLNRQGPDVGTQYRSAIFFHNESQEAAAKESIAAKEGTFSRPVVTEVVPVGDFYRAEEYHQQYFDKMGIRH
ncbi:MAG: peptide-methionine (S)-S-oxide reductase MsrA [Acidimicrobiia bacterium]